MRFVPLALLVSLGIVGLSLILPAAENPPDLRSKSEAAFKAGNFKDAYEFGVGLLSVFPRAPV